ncbi:structure-specific endonuclease subunit slx1-like [Diadema antillarum]|uniref:structure-specific endonuclease subunit slx1-like n=1 Tax=Diadema antillarum TaxID=105358 RepID=UPI003A8434AE
MVKEVENFHGCYLLVSKNTRYKGWTYIGYTVDPKRRINQHNQGCKFGGARRTSGKGPWDMVLIIYGFPNEISALRFEWAWQHPKKSRRLRHVPAKKSRENSFQYRFRVVSNMLRTGPWCRLPLTIQWLLQEYQQDFDVSLRPPEHMPISYGQVTSTKVGDFGNPKRKKKRKKGKMEAETSESTTEMSDDEPIAIPASQTAGKRCFICATRFTADDSTLTCLYPQCQAEYHTLCLSQRFLRRTPDQLLPVEGACPKCKEDVLWGNLIRKKQGCFAQLSQISEEDEAGHWADDLRD